MNKRFIDLLNEEFKSRISVKDKWDTSTILSNFRSATIDASVRLIDELSAEARATFDDEDDLPF